MGDKHVLYGSKNVSVFPSRRIRGGMGLRGSSFPLLEIYPRCPNTLVCSPEMSAHIMGLRHPTRACAPGCLVPHRVPSRHMCQVSKVPARGRSSITMCWSRLSKSKARLRDKHGFSFPTCRSRGITLLHSVNPYSPSQPPPYPGPPPGIF